jgi:hypothetical protein
MFKYTYYGLRGITESKNKFPSGMIRVGREPGKLSLERVTLDGVWVWDPKV